jgi:hypothetical protein
MSPEWCADPEAEDSLAKVKALLDDVNVEDKGCTEKVYRGLMAGLSSPGPLSHLERPNFEFATYLASKIPAWSLSFPGMLDAWPIERLRLRWRLSGSVSRRRRFRRPSGNWSPPSACSFSCAAMRRACN